VNLTAAVATAVGKYWSGTLQEITTVHEAAYRSVRKIQKVVLGLTKKSTQNHTNTVAEVQDFLAAKSIRTISHQPDSPYHALAHFFLLTEDENRAGKGFPVPGHI
jgi:hypothetical protein